MAPRRGHIPWDEDRRSQIQHPRHARNGASVVAIRGRHERERSQGFEPRLEILDPVVIPETFVPKPFFKRPVDRPRRAKDLEGRQPEPV